jgi:gamma-glutamylputrescine oxidase
MDLLTANDRPSTYPNSWYAETARLLEPFPPLEGDARVDVCIIGGGYTGLSAALHLAERGLSVALLEAHRVGWGASGRNGGQVGSGQRQDQDWLEAAVGRTQARVFWDLGEEAKGLVRDLITRHGIDCDLRDGIAYVGHKQAHADAYRSYAEKLAREYGYDAARPLDRAEAADLLRTDTVFGGMLDRNAAHLHPLNYALGLASAAVKAGAKIFERSRVTSINGTTVSTGHGKVLAEHVIVACNGYAGSLFPAVAARAMPINNFIVATGPLDVAEIPQGVAAADSRFVVNYWRPTPDNRLLFGGGESYGYRFPRDIEGLVRRALASVYPRLAEVEVSHAWGGTLSITMNRMPAFQRLSSGVYSVAGYSGHGVATATLAGKLMAEVATGTASRFDLMASLPQPSFPGGARMRWPLLVLAMAWYSLRDRF